MSVSVRGGVRAGEVGVHVAWWALVLVSLLRSGVAGVAMAEPLGVGAPPGWVLFVLVSTYAWALVLEARAAHRPEGRVRLGDAPAHVVVLLVGAVACLVALIAVGGLSMMWTLLLGGVPLATAVAVETWMSSWWLSGRRSA